MDYLEAYERVRAAKGDYHELLVVDQRRTAVFSLQRIAEMILVREYDDWYLGSPQPNIAKSIVIACQRLADQSASVSGSVQLAAALLAWTYLRLGHQTDGAYLLLEHVIAHVAPPADDPLGEQEPWPELTQAVEDWRAARQLPANLGGLAAEERLIWNEIARWELSTTGALSGFTERPEQPRGDDAQQPTRGIAQLVGSALQQALGALCATAEVFVRDERLLQEVRTYGYDVTSVEDLRTLPVEVLDEISHRSLRAGKALSAVEGAGTGAGGLLLAAVDVPALLTINLRFISQIAHTYGFETASRQEQAFVLNVLGAASAKGAARGAFVDDNNRLAQQLALKGPLRQLDSKALAALAKKVVELIGRRLTERKLAQLVPIVGAVVGGGINYAYTRDTLVAARMMYRKRRLVECCVAPWAIVVAE